MKLKSNLTIITLNQPGISDFSAARNAELAKVKTDWVLFVDSDEKITPALKDEIIGVCNQASSPYGAYFIPRLDTFQGRALHHGETGHAKFIRLARRDWGKWTRPVHEVWLVRRSLGVGGVGDDRVGELKNPLLHTPHPSISSFLTKINQYSTLEAQYRYTQGVKSSLFKILVYPLAKFKLNYLFRFGFLDGVPGAIMAIMMSFHSYLTWTKLYLLWHKK
ncbi:MAG: Glycosyl transferase family 2 [Microgenomates group bacterium GW2011_GWA2_46_7]|nr:MAG: Glycosyl transferase family 2 [Microgenomates group bacterium GW2011_GWA2_46_7]